MMQEVVRRRYSGSLSEELPAPDLILVDGGKGQLGAAVEVLTELGITTPILGLAKQHEEIFVPGRSTPIRLLATSPVLHLIQHLRDEAHRFAVTYHRRVRGKQVEASALDEIPGIGPKRKAALLSTFGSLERIAQADPEEIAKIAHISHSQVQALLRRLPNSRSRHGHQDRPEADRV